MAVLAGGSVIVLSVAVCTAVARVAIGQIFRLAGIARRQTHPNSL